MAVFKYIRIRKSLFAQPHHRSITDTPTRHAVVSVWRQWSATHKRHTYMYISPLRAARAARAAHCPLRCSRKIRARVIALVCASSPALPHVTAATQSSGQCGDRERVECDTHKTHINIFTRRNECVVNVWRGGDSTPIRVIRAELER